MLVIPKLEVAGGICVRTGEPGASLPGDPAATAGRWSSEGFSRVQVADLDALAGRRSNLVAMETIARDGSVEVDVAAGSESVEQIESCLDAGASGVILGPRALAEFEWLESAVGLFPGMLMIETNLSARRVVTRGWVRTLPVDLLDLAEELGGLALGGLVVASREPADGLELALLEDVAEACAFPVLVEDNQPTVSALRAYEHRGIAGVVVPGDALAAMLDVRSVASEFGR